MGDPSDGFLSMVYRCLDHKNYSHISMGMKTAGPRDTPKSTVALRVVKSLRRASVKDS